MEKVSKKKFRKVEMEDLIKAMKEHQKKTGESCFHLKLDLIPTNEEQSKPLQDPFALELG